MTLVEFWFIVITVLWTGFFVLEGFDFGVGMLHGLIGKDEAGRRAAINTIGPLWDGNEVWLIVAGAAMFAAFPGWYADHVLRACTSRWCCCWSRSSCAACRSSTAASATAPAGAAPGARC